MIANGVYERAQALRLAQAAVLAKNREDPRKGLLAHIFDCVQGLEPRPELYLEQLGKVLNKMLLRLAVTCAKSSYVSRIESVKFQNQPRGS
jgi:hypothetical protein